MALSKGKLGKAPVPNLRVDVLVDAVLPLIWKLFDLALPVRAFP